MLLHPGAYRTDVFGPRIARQDTSDFVSASDCKSSFARLLAMQMCGEARLRSTGIPNLPDAI